MANLGKFVKKYPVKWTISLIYFIPVVILVVVFVLIGRNYSSPDKSGLWAIFGVIALLVILLQYARYRALPKYNFELFENGLKVVCRKEVQTETQYEFADIVDIWEFAIGNNAKTNYLALKGATGNYQVISPKYANSQQLIANLLAGYKAARLPLLVESVNQGHRISFAVMPEDGEKVVQTEKAIIPYLQQATWGQISIDRFSLFDGNKTYSIADIQNVQLDDATGNIIVHSLIGTPLYTKSFFAIDNAGLLVELLNALVSGHNKNEKSEEMPNIS